MPKNHLAIDRKKLIPLIPGIACLLPCAVIYTNVYKYETNVRIQL